MKFKLEKEIPPTFENMNNCELAAHIRHYYPSLEGPLLALLQAFERLADNQYTKSNR